MDKKENVKEDIKTKEKNKKEETKKTLDNKKTEAKEKKEDKIQENKSPKANKDAKADKNIKKDKLGTKENEKTKEVNTTELIKNEDIAKDEKKLDKIKSAIKENKEKSKNNANKNEKYMRILQNIIIAVMGIAYITINIMGSKRIPSEQYQIDLKVFIILSVVSAILLFEKAFKADKFRFALLGIELLVLGGATVMLLHLYRVQNPNTLKYSKYFILIWLAYYIIKTIIISIKRVDLDKKATENN